MMVNTRNNRLLVAVFGVLLVLIFGLSIGIIVLNNQEDPEIDDPGISDIDKRNEILTEINTFIRKNDAEEVEPYLNRKIKEYAGTELELEVRLIQVNFLGSEGQYERALYLANQLAKENLSDEGRMELYLSFITLYEHMGDEEKAQEYRTLYSEEYKKNYGGGFGSE